METLCDAYIQLANYNVSQYRNETSKQFCLNSAKLKRETCIQTSTLWVVLLRNCVEIKCFLVAILLSLKCCIPLISFRGNKFGQKAVDHAAERDG